MLEMEACRPVVYLPSSRFVCGWSHVDAAEGNLNVGHGRNKRAPLRAAARLRASLPVDAGSGARCARPYQ